jgi:integrase
VAGEKGIYRETRADGTQVYLIRWRDGLGRERTKVLPSLREARAAQRAVLVDRDRGTETRPAGERITFRSYAATYMDRHPEWQPGTRQAVADRLVRINRALGGRRLATIVAGDIRAYLAGLTADGLAPSTVAAHKNLIGTILREAVHDRLIAHNPAQAVKVSRPARSAAARSARLTPEQVTALVDALPEWWKPFAWLIAWTGLRGGEAAGLTVDRVDLLHRTLTVDRQLLGADRASKAPRFGPVKTASSNRVLPIGDNVAELLAEHLRTRPLGVDGLLFTTRTGRPMTRGQRSGAFRAAAEWIELPEAARGWHALRHTYGSTLLDNGVDVVTVSAWLGHDGPTETLATYAHVDPARLTETADVAASVLRRTS